MLGIGGEANNLSAECFGAIPAPAHIFEELGRPPGVDEVLSNMRMMRCGKDEVRMELIRNASVEAQTLVAELVKRLWETPAADWEPECKAALAVLLYKHKGSRRDLSNIRGICLLSLSPPRFIATRLRDWAEQNGGNVDEQYGFRPYRSTVDVIFISRCLVEMAARTPSDSPASRVVLVLLDLRKAYPNVPRQACWAVLSSLGVPSGMLTVLRGLHETTRYEIQSPQGRSRPYMLKRGLREGCPSSCVVFNLYHSWVMRRVEVAVGAALGGGCFGLTVQYDRTGGAPVHGVWAEKLRYQQRHPERLASEHFHRVLFAGDTTLATRERDRAATETAAADCMRLWGEYVHPGKTERLAIDHASRPPEEGAAANYTHSVRLLGAWLYFNGGTKTDTAKRLAAARSLWGR